MFLGIDGKYSAFEELMHYYHFDFKVYYILFIIVLVNSTKSVINYISIKRGKTLITYSSIIDLFISVLAGIGLGYGMVFQGILSDISNKYFEIWGNKLFVLCVVSFILFVVQFIFTIKARDKSSKNEIY